MLYKLQDERCNLIDCRRRCRFDQNPERFCRYHLHIINHNYCGLWSIWKALALVIKNKIKTYFYSVYNEKKILLLRYGGLGEGGRSLLYHCVTEERAGVGKTRFLRYVIYERPQ